MGGVAHNFISNYTARQMVVLDESTKDGQTLIQKYGHAISGQDPFLKLPFSYCGIWYSILPAVTLDGYITVWIVEGSIDGAEFYDFIINNMVSMQLIIHFDGLLWPIYAASFHEFIPQSKQHHNCWQLLNT